MIPSSVELSTSFRTLYNNVLKFWYYNSLNSYSICFNYPCFLFSFVFLFFIFNFCCYGPQQVRFQDLYYYWCYVFFFIWINWIELNWTIGEFLNYQPFPKGLWGVLSPQRHSYWTFQLCSIQWLLQLGVFGEYLPSNFSCHTKRTLELLISLQMYLCWSSRISD